MNYLKTMISVLVLLAVISCQKNQTEGGGQVCFTVSGNEIVADMTKSKVSEYTTLPSTEDFSISVSGSGYQWSGKISDWDETTVLLAGEYEVTASCGAIDTEGFDAPYFVGTQSFTVTGGETSSVSIPVSLGNTIVKVSCSDDFKRYYKDYTFKVTRDGTAIVEFVKDESRAAFVDGYKISVEGTLTAESKTYSFQKEYTNLDEATAYTFHFDVSNVGGSSITIKFNDNVETIDLGDFELND